MTHDQLTERLASVERDIRVLKWMWVLLAVGLALTQRFPVAGSYSAQSYVLSNSQGQRVGSFALESNGLPALELRTPEQDVAIQMQVTPEHGALITLTGSSSVASVSAGASPLIQLNGPEQDPWSAP